jgi:type IV pilus assembly protein PilA
VAMIGILSTLAVVGYRKYLNSARSGDARAVVSAIRVAEESYRAETLNYLSCSADLKAYYPGTPFTKDPVKRHFRNPGHKDWGRWAILNVTTDKATYYGYAVVAGAPGTTPVTPNTAAAPAWTTVVNEPWYVIQATGDLDNDGNPSYFVSSSFSGEIYFENDSE